MNPVLRVRGLTVSDRSGRRLLNGVSLDVAAGERVLVVGASGSGKSTLLRLIAGLTPPGVGLSGSVEVLGEEVLGRDAAAGPLPVGWLPQDPAAAVCLPRVGDDVAFGCESRLLGVEQIDAAVTRSLDLVDAAGWRDRDTATLSAGQAQRVGLAAGIAPGQQLLLLDEPTSMLDPAALRRVRDALTTLAATADAPAVLLVEHRLDEWADGADLPERIVVLDRGELVADGPAEQVWHRHASALIEAGCHLPWPVEQRERQRAGMPAYPTRTDAARPAPGEASPVRTQVRTSQPALRAEALAVGHSGRSVLRNVELSVHPGEVVALIGVSGAGKTTLLHTLAGITPPLAGRVHRAGGRPAIIFQSPEQQFVAPTVAAELAFDGAGQDRVEAALHELRLDGLADASVYRLSGGEQRRLSVGSVLLGSRQVVLADEPTFGLDRNGVAWTTAALRRAAAEGRAVLVSSHDLRFVLEVADRVQLVHDGSVHGGGGTADELREAGLGRAGLLAPPSVRDLLGVSS